MRKRNRGGALLLVLLLTLGGAWPAYAAEPETPPPAATEESGLRSLILKLFYTESILIDPHRQDFMPHAG